MSEFVTEIMIALPIGSAVLFNPRDVHHPVLSELRIRSFWAYDIRPYHSVKDGNLLYRKPNGDCGMFLMEEREHIELSPLPIGCEFQTKPSTLL